MKPQATPCLAQALRSGVEYGDASDIDGTRTIGRFCRQIPHQARSADFYGLAILSSRKSGCWSRVNSMAKPPSTWRTTRPGVFPSVINAPIGGRVLLSIAAPESETSTIRHVMEVPFGMVTVERGLR